MEEYGPNAESSVRRHTERATQPWTLTLEVLDYAGELHENWFAVPKVKRALKKLD